MLDLETLGVTPGCAILSIGAVFFDPKTGEEGEQFYQPVDHLVGGYRLRTEQSTEAWWNRQSPEARAVFTDPGRVGLAVALDRFNTFLRSGADKPTVWGNGADFDNPILTLAYKAAGIPQGWGPYEGRCYRTVKNLFPSVKIQRTVGVHHNALADARNQAQHLMAIARVADVVWE